jgi:hypothetical protein
MTLFLKDRHRKPKSGSGLIYERTGKGTANVSVTRCCRENY